MGIENIKSLNQLDEWLKAAEEKGDGAIRTSRWGSRDFILFDPDPHVNSTFLVKMKDIISVYETLSKRDDIDKNLVVEIHDRICGLDLRGEKKLGKEWIGAIFLRNIRNFTDSSHLKRLDKVENDVIFDNDTKNEATGIMERFNDKGDRQKYLKSLSIKVFFEFSSKNGNETKNALHYIVQENPKIALELLESLQSAILEASFGQNIPFIQSFQEFRNLMVMDINARPEFRDVLLKLEKVKIRPEKDNEALSTKTVQNIQAPLIEPKESNIAPEVKSDHVSNSEMRASIMSTINKTKAIDGKFTTKIPLEQQRMAHENAKTEGFAMLQNLGATTEVISPPPPATSTKLKAVQIGELNSKVFSWEVTNGVREDILKDGNREGEDVVIYSVASQFNGCESPGRYTPQPGNAVRIYEGDHTQGPQAQLAFDPFQVEAINYMANLGFNGLAKLLTEKSKGAVQHGYLTPVGKNIDEVTDLLQTQCDKIEYLCVANKPQEGTKPVHQILISAPAFGSTYNLDAELDEQRKEEVQFQCALNGFRAQFLQAAKLSQNGTVPVTLKAVAVGLGVFDNNPEVVAKAFYQAGNEFEAVLKENKVQVRFQVYEKSGTNSSLYDNDAAHIMKDHLKLEKFASTG